MVPGVLLHGSGHFVLGCEDEAAKLLWAEVTGLGLVLAALAPAPIFGAHPVLVPFQAVLGMSGFALFMGSWLFDIYGSLVPPAARGGPMYRVPLLETKLGYRYVYDPLFDYRHFVVQGFSLWLGRLGIMPESELAPTGGNGRYRLPVAWRFWGPTPDRQASDGSFLDLVAAGTHHHFGADGFDVDTLEIALSSRLDAARYAEGLSGMFLEWGAGVGLNRYRYAAPGAGIDDNSLLLMSFALGSSFGDPTWRGGEVKFGYDHRHDDLVAGTKGWLIGVAGHFGVQARGYFDETWGLLLDAQVGSAYALSLALLHRQGGS